MVFNKKSFSFFRIKKYNIRNNTTNTYISVHSRTHYSLPVFPLQRQPVHKSFESWYVNSERSMSIIFRHYRTFRGVGSDLELPFQLASGCKNKERQRIKQNWRTNILCLLFPDALKRVSAFTNFWDCRTEKSLAVGWKADMAVYSIQWKDGVKLWSPQAQWRRGRDGHFHFPP